MGVNLREADKLRKQLFTQLLEIGEPNIDYRIDRAVMLPYKDGKGLGMLLSKKEVTEERNVKKDIEDAINKTAQRVGVPGNFHAVYYEDSRTAQIEEKSSASQIAFLLALKGILNQRSLELEKYERTLRHNGKKPKVPPRDRYNPLIINFMHQCGIKSFKDYKQYLSLREQYADALLGLMDKKSIVSIGYYILESRTIKRGDISILLKEEDTDEFTKTAIEKNYSKSLEDCFSKLQLQGSSFKLEYVLDENTLYIKRGSQKGKTLAGQKQTLELLAGLHAYNLIVLKRDTISNTSDSSYNASNTPKQSA